MIACLVAVVSVVRLTHGTASSENYETIKLKGPRNAPIHVVVYSDFQCPACRTALQPLEDLRAQFSNVMQIEFRHFPLAHNHRWAITAATFAECAAEQGRFWEFHDKLYLEQPIWSKSEGALSFLAGYTQEVGLNRQVLEQCLQNPKTLAKIRRDHSMGEKQKVESTPTFFINGRPLIGALQLTTNGKEIVLDELKKAGINPEGSEK